MSYAQAQTALAALPGDTTDDAKVAYADVTVYNWRSVFVSYRTFRAFFADRGDDDPKARTDAIAAAVQATDSLAHQMLLMTADGGGVDLARPESRGQIAALQGGGLFSSDEVNALYDSTLYGRVGPARSNPRPRYEAEWGLSEFTADTLANLADRVKFETLAAAVDGLLGGIDRTLAFAAATPDAAVTFRGSAVADLPGLRDDLQALSMDYGDKVANGEDVADMPADAAGAWDRVTEGGN